MTNNERKNDQKEVINQRHEEIFNVDIQTIMDLNKERTLGGSKGFWKEIARITEVSLSLEKFFTMHIVFDLEIGAQGISLILCEPIKDERGKFIERIVSPYGMKLVTDIMRMFDVEEFHELKGKAVMIYKTVSGGFIDGIGQLPCDGKERVIFKQYFKRDREEGEEK